MENGFAIFKDGVVVATEGDFGNAAELEMVLSEMNPDSKFEIRRFENHGAIIHG